jgi:putative endonuclease
MIKKIEGGIGAAYYVYILQCADNTLYTGITTDISRRVDEHNGVLPGGARYTRGRGPVRLVYSMIFPDRSSALKEEFRIKSLTRAQKDKLVD